ncbi:MAG: DUF692 domain-containing protein [Candidatus Thiodiazotropha weberae]|uniref:UPF0276 protein A3196_04215 n=1 Tax=Candidatus Thiodiazotropha endoloripes TaxID=1818881 RepID=A0A1E2UNB2_9GAMM|nr:DUF692 domain-containing protein [Candidatus Thiodiazotropha endoloripes]MCG7900343.1 DUF692 domain-containing protein [Candidatus Thiodiazotropha weberae]MCG7902298.1 DUF692 domain-containing protein [Candidatus Thiodiazotropha weberae]MCG7912648.1 DUF692 domain-containing protein [Candidatus Thiodiazotropha weberae]ODB93430.1 hypothetical protein A3194_01695 [Candidatus Thiodiazotropha endoloripes]ODB96034.1 hypothetical protein A3196_04215 [Candidatus Thiodiazotropha endoloripes]
METIHKSGRKPTPVPIRAGAGLKPQHYQSVIEDQPDIGWFEIHPENYMGRGGPPLRYLEKIRQDYPISLHSVGTSLGSHLPLDMQHLQQLKALVERFEPGLVSEHLSWSHGYEWYTHDLMPLVYTEESLQLMVEHIDQVQEYLQRPILIENPSSYLQFKASEMPEQVFYVEAAKRSGAGLLVDVNNVFVSCTNHGWNIDDYLSEIPIPLIGEIHLSGHSVQQVEGRTLRIDDHGSPVCSEVWSLYQQFISQFGLAPTLIEWDSNIPQFPQLLEEVSSAQSLMDRVAETEVRHVVTG